MIKLENVNKYFNRYKKNEIHVINNTSVTFPSNGLVALLGPSGCGKTTLLNTIGGLDKVNSGHIYVDGKRITKRRGHKVDEIRNLNIGYIFQDYKLVDTMTVYENVALSLKLIGIKDKEEIQKRVMYTLESVGMARYKNRPCNMLSGGERQRVGIARALVKNPKIIIADEPTGNLDSKNSLEVMNIIKSISAKYLVILVTHEEELAKFYATRILEIKDGVIVNDYENTNVGTLNYKIENQIYLQDFKNIEKITKDNINIDIYRDNNEDLNISVVFRNGNIYIKTKGNEKLEVVENNSNIELIDGHYEEIKSIENINNNYDIESISNNNIKPKYSSIFKLGSFISYGFKKVISYPILKKILLGGFFLSGMFIFYSVSSILATINVKDEDFVTINRDYLTASIRNIQVDDYLSYEKLDNINYILPNNSLVNFKVKYDDYLQTQNGYGVFTGSLTDINLINSKNLIQGRMPNNENEIVVDKMVLNKFIGDTSKMAGIFTINDLLNRKVYLNNMDSFTIVGITDLEEPNVYTNKNLFINMIAGSVSDNDYGIYEEDMDNRLTYIDYNLLNNKEIKLVKGNLPVNDYEVIVNINNEIIMPINKTIDKQINNKKLKVVGYYTNTTSTNHEEFLVNNNMIKYDLISKAANITVYSKDKKNTLKYFQEQNINIKDSYDYAKTIYIDNQKDTMISTLTLSGIILGISLIEILLMIRSSFLSRIKEVGIFRAIGLKKTDIYKMFSGEILVITLIASITGISFMTYLLYCITRISYLENMFMVNIFTYILSIILVLIFNLVVGLLPVFNTIRKTPAQILARFDVD